MLAVSTPDCLLRDRTNDNSIIPPLRSPPAAANTVQSVASSHSSCSNQAYQAVVSRVTVKLGSQLRTAIFTEIEGAVRLQLDALLPAVLGLEHQVSPDAARTEWIASLEERMVQKIEKVALTIITPLSPYFQVSIEKRMSGPVRSQVDSQLPDTAVLVHQVRTQVERVPLFHLQPCSFGSQPGSLVATMKDPSKEPNRTKPANLSKVYPTRMGNKSYRRGRRCEGEVDTPSHKP